MNTRLTLLSTKKTNSQRNESLNSTIGAKNPKTRYYGGSESNDFRVACGVHVAQTNIDYSYTAKALEHLNIEPGFHHIDHAAAMDKRVAYNKQRKTTKEFKSRRSQLARQKTTQTLRKESNEGTTYGSSVGLNLDTTKSADSQIAIDLSEKIPLTEFKRYEQLVSPHKPRPTQVSLLYDPMRKHKLITITGGGYLTKLSCSPGTCCLGVEYTKKKIIVFDTETTCTGRAAELCQISATSEDGKHEFSHYILPKSNISSGASLVNNLTIKSINGKRTLCKSNSTVVSVNPGKALQDFITFLKQLQDKDSNSTLVLIGHNSATFDVPILLRNSDRTFQDIILPN